MQSQASKCRKLTAEPKQVVIIDTSDCEAIETPRSSNCLTLTKEIDSNLLHQINMSHAHIQIPQSSPKMYNHLLNMDYKSTNKKESEFQNTGKFNSLQCPSFNHVVDKYANQSRDSIQKNTIILDKNELDSQRPMKSN